MSRVRAQELVQGFRKLRAPERARMIAVRDDHDFQIGEHARHAIDADFQRIFLADDREHGHLVVLELLPGERQVPHASNASGQRLGIVVGHELLVASRQLLARGGGTARGA